jgi:hypothetical protein
MYLAVFDDVVEEFFACVFDDHDDVLRCLNDFVSVLSAHAH